ncbi:MAG: hypothetical protein V2A73_12005, partial [Pseudomonadota bacterium]
MAVEHTTLGRSRGASVPRGCDRCSLVPVEGDENGASATPDVDVSRSDRHGKAPEGAQAVP